MMEKKVLREKIQGRLKKMSRPEYEHQSYLIAQQLFNTADWQNASVIATTISRKPEVDTYQIIRKAWEEKKRVVVPKCYPKDKTMVFRELTAFNELESVYYGLLEPIEEKTAAVAKNEIELMIVPGLAFTRKGYRLGFGGGYYDRYLQDFQGKKISLLFKDIQLVEDLPVENHDLPVQAIIHEKGQMAIDG